MASTLVVENSPSAPSRAARFKRIALAVSIVALLLMIPLTWMVTGAGHLSLFTASLLGILLFLAAVVGMLLVTLRGPRPVGKLMQLVSLLSPTVLLMTVFPLIVGQLDTVMIGQTEAMIVVLAVAVTTPWISSAATMPVYGPLGDTSRSDTETFFRKFCSLWPGIFAWTGLPLLLFSAVVFAFLGWGPHEIFFYLVGVAANVLFAQSLVPAQETGRFNFVFAAWLAYALTLLFAPQLWFLAPVVGVLPQLFLIRRGMGGLLHPAKPNRPEILRQLGNGLLHGGVLWADKFFLILLYIEDVDIVMVYVALLPVVVAQGVYFASQYDVLRYSMDRLRVLVDKSPCRKLRKGSLGLSARVESSLGVTVLIAALAGLGLMLSASVLGFPYTMEMLVLLCAPIAMLCLMLMAFQLAQLQHHREAAVICAIHLLVVAASILLLPPVPAYLVIIVVDVIAVWFALQISRAAFLDSAYLLFWKEAVKW